MKESIEGRQQIEEDHEPRCNHYDPRADFNLPHVRFEPCEYPPKLVYPYTQQQERYTQPERIEQQQDDSPPKCGGTRRQAKNRSENETNAGSPSHSKNGNDQE